MRAAEAGLGGRGCPRASTALDPAPFPHPRPRGGGYSAGRGRATATPIPTPTDPHPLRPASTGDSTSRSRFASQSISTKPPSGKDELGSVRPKSTFATTGRSRQPKSSLAAWAQSDLKRMVAYLSINHLGYCMLGLFAVTATSAASTIDMHAALSGVFMQIFNHGVTAAALFYYVGLLEERRGLRSINNFGGLMQRTPLLCAWMSVAMFSSLGCPD